jgi:hypothetical protein
MKNKKLWIAIVFLGLTLSAASAALFLQGPSAIYAGKLIFHGETATYSYSGEVLEHTGDVLVNVYYLYGGEKGYRPIGRLTPNATLLFLPGKTLKSSTSR